MLKLSPTERCDQSHNSTQTPPKLQIPLKLPQAPMKLLLNIFFKTEIRFRCNFLSFSIVYVECGNHLKVIWKP